MTITFRTNIDHYQGVRWPHISSRDGVPRISDNIKIADDFVKIFRDKKLPIKLEVVEVTWCETGVVCELHYRDIDVKLAKISGVKLY